MKWFLTGGAGFIGCNAAAQLLKEGHEVVVFDNLSRSGTDANLVWLKDQGLRTFIHGDVRDARQVVDVFRTHRDIGVVLHLAAQVAVTTSVMNPREDFEVNALGTLNVCEAVRQCAPEAILLNASTNKVYGELPHVHVVKRNGRYAYADLPGGVPETAPLDFHSPYGCSKGAADSYVKDYARIYGLRTVSFRQSCIFGPRQFGIEDQGWVAWFAIAAVRESPITVYGDGKQVRDVLFIDDLVQCYVRAVERIEQAVGQVYNIGGGPGQTMAVSECLQRLEQLLGRRIPYRVADWRPGDQRVFVCDISKAQRELGWQPRTGTDEGLERLVSWVKTHETELSHVVAA